MWHSRRIEWEKEETREKNLFNYLSIYRSLLNLDVIDRENIILDQFYDWEITPTYQHVYESGILIHQAISQF